ncbi:MAG: hypothetical protein GY861_02840 [bacterium]|nr:hypothetical protein [bacterium]
MANPSTAPFGLRPVRYVDGTPWNGQTIRCYIHASYATALFIGDPVVMETALANKDTTVKHPTIIRASVASGSVMRGVITSFEPNPDNLTRQYSPASTQGWANVVFATPDLIFQVRDDGDATPSKVFPGQNGILAAGSGGSTSTGLSSFVLDGSTTPTTTQAHTIHIHALADIPDNEMADYGIWDVIINTSRNTTGTFLGVTAA